MSVCVVSFYLGPVPLPIPCLLRKKSPQDITGEAPFMKTSAEMYDAKAKENKALKLDSRGHWHRSSLKITIIIIIISSRMLDITDLKLVITSPVFFGV